MASALTEIPGRIKRGVRRHGVLGAVRAAPYLSEQPVWYALELPPAGPIRALPDGVVLRRGDAGDARALDQELLRVRPTEAVGRFDTADCELWLAEADERVLFACWLFFDRAPAASAPAGWLTLPASVACLEDSMAAVAARGRGIAPATWMQLGRDLADRGCRTLITKVDRANEPSTRAVGKVGFEAVLELRVRRLGPLWRTRVEHAAAVPLAGELLAQLRR